MNGIINDAEARRLIARRTDSNFLVEASAGSGKTTALVGRMAALVKSGADVSRICAITFTKAAAREFYGRFQKLLVEESQNESLSEIERQRCAEALKNIDLCFMDTIDSFAHTVLREHPAQAGLPSDAKIFTVQELMRIYGAEYSALISGAYGSELMNKCLLLRKCFNRPRQVFAEGMNMVLARRDLHIPFKKPRGNLESLPQFKKFKSNTVTLMDLILSRQDLANDKDDRKKFADLKAKMRFLREPNASYQDILDVLKTADGYCMKDDPRKAGIPIELFDDIGKNKHIYCLRATERLAIYKALREEQYGIVMDLLTSAAEPVSEACRARGQLGFYDCLLYLRDMLKNDAAQGGKIISHIYARRSYFLIDEFQDTDPLQAQIFFYITAENPEPDWLRCRPRPGSLFIVGDPKQSIYRFKRADISSYKQVRGLFENGVGQVLTLSRNFRSSRELCTQFNTAFSQIMPADTADQCAFPPIPLPDPGPAGVLDGVFSYRCSVYGRRGDPSKDSPRVAELIDHLVSGGYTVFDGKSVRPVRYGDIMVITPTRYSLPDIMGELEARHIPMRVEGNTAFEKCPGLVAAAAVMAAAAFPYDHTSVYRALTSAALGISDRELMKLRAAKISLSLYEDADKIEPISHRCAEGFRKLSELSEEAKTSSPAELLAHIVDRFRLLELTGSRNMQYLTFALELLRKAVEDRKVLSCKDGSAFIDRLFEAEGREERCAALRKNENAVHMANLHKVKGLEAPVVILASPFRNIYPPKDRTVNFGDPPSYYIFDSGSFSTGAFPDEAALEAQSASAERDRLLYVAATRARAALIISDPRTKDGKPSDKNPWLRLLSLPHREISCSEPPRTDGSASVSAKALYDSAEAHQLTKRRELFEPTYTLVIPSKLSLRKTGRENATVEAQDRRKLPRGAAATLGTLIHRYLEITVSSRWKTDDEAVIREIISDSGLTDPLYEEGLRAAASQMKNGGYPQKNGLPTDLFGELRQAEQIMCELPFCYCSGGQLIHGIMDLAYIKDGSCHIIDYKTSADGTDLDTVYADQLSEYKRVFRQLMGVDADAHIYHIDL